MNLLFKGAIIHNFLLWGILVWSEDLNVGLEYCFAVETVYFTIGMKIFFFF